MARITGVGGVFIKSKGDGKALAEWYRKHLGMPVESWGGAVLKWADDKARDDGATAWRTAKSDSKWFAPSDSQFMINYCVDNMAEMVKQLKAGGVTIVKGPESDDYGTFVWVMDPDGNKVELWEPKKGESVEA